jgi:hypothetical protein
MIIDQLEEGQEMCGKAAARGRWMVDPLHCGSARRRRRPSLKRRSSENPIERQEALLKELKKCL